ncbi:glycosyl hydrolase family 20 domain 2 [Bacteroides sp. CAG:754]|nr:glycosyl hydrolase family 20 domain 2 [Bacteroides sp. CAG:754]
MLEVKLECIRPDVKIHYTTDGSEPTATSPLYEKIVPVREPLTLKSATFAQSKQMEKTLILPVRWNPATTKPVLGDSPAVKLLTNGIRGSLKYSDSEWCSWTDNDSVSFTIDLLKPEVLNTLTLGYITNNGMAIHKPASHVRPVQASRILFDEVILE